MPDVVELPVYATWTFTTSARRATSRSWRRRLEPDTRRWADGLPRRPRRRHRICSNRSSAGQLRVRGHAGRSRSHSRPASCRDGPARGSDDGMRSLLEAGAGASRGAPRCCRRLRPGHGRPDRRTTAVRLVRRRRVHRATTGWLERSSTSSRDGAPQRDSGQRSSASTSTTSSPPRGTRPATSAPSRRSSTEAASPPSSGAAMPAGFDALSDGALLQATGRLHVFVPAGAVTAAGKLHDSAIVPTALTSPAFARADP